MVEMAILPPTWDVPQAFRQRLGSKAGRQRAMMADGHLLLILHAPPKDEHEREGRLFWRKPDGSWMSDRLGSGIHALQKHLAEYEETLQRLSRAEEEAGTAEQYFAVLDQLMPLHRAGRNLHRTLQQAREFCEGAREIIDARDRAYSIERTGELLFSETKNSLDFLVAKQAEKQSRSSHQMAVASHRLTLLAGFFFPVATLTAIFGVNLEHGWEQRLAPIPFYSVLAAGLIMGAIVTAFVTRTPRLEG